MWRWLRTFPLRLSLARRGFKATRIEDLFGAVLQGIPLSKFTDYDSFLRAGSGQIWASWRACDLVGKVISDTKFKLKRKDGETAEVNKPEITSLLEAPNPFWEWSEMLYKWVFHIKMTGNAYWLKDESNAQGDRPKALFALNPKRMRIAVDSKKGLVGYLYEAQGKQFAFQPQEIIHFRHPHPDDEFYGIGDIEAGAPLFQDFLNRDRYSKNFWAHGAAPTGLLTTTKDVVDVAEFDAAKKKWQSEMAGVSNSAKIAWLTGEWEYHKIGLTPAEMESLEGSEMTIQNIFRMHGVPLSVAGFETAVNRSTAYQADIQFRRYTIKPEVNILTRTLQTDLINGFDPNIKLEPQIDGLIDVEDVNLLQVWFDRGVLSRNEIREKLGLARLDDDPTMDQRYMISALLPAELSGIADQGQMDQQAQATVERFVSQSLSGRNNGNSEVAKAIEHMTAIG